jgi:hypothetical protein
MPFEYEPSDVTKRLQLFDIEDFETINSRDNTEENNAKFFHHIISKDEETLTMAFKEDVDDSACPDPECSATVAGSVIDEDTNEFISECAGCKMRFLWSV